jgi:archaellum component FlaC
MSEEEENLSTPKCSNPLWVSAWAQAIFAFMMIVFSVIAYMSVDIIASKLDRGSSDLHVMSLLLEKMSEDMGAMESHTGNMSMAVTDMSENTDSMSTDVKSLSHTAKDGVVILGNVDNKMGDIRYNLEHMDQNMRYLRGDIGKMKNNITPRGMFQNMFPF